jgi:hypothetical protein
LYDAVDNKRSIDSNAVMSPSKRLRFDSNAEEDVLSAEEPVAATPMRVVCVQRPSEVQAQAQTVQVQDQSAPVPAQAQSAAQVQSLQGQMPQPQICMFEQMSAGGFVRCPEVCVEHGNFTYRYCAAHMAWLQQVAAQKND